MHNKAHGLASVDHTATANRMFYSNTGGTLVELAFGAAGSSLRGAGGAVPPAFKLDEAPVSVGTITATPVVIDLSVARIFKLIVQVPSLTINFTNIPGTGLAYDFILRFTQDAVGGRQLAGFQFNGSPIGPLYEGGVPLALTGTPNSMDDLHLLIEYGALTVKMAGRDMHV